MIVSFDFDDTLLWTVPCLDFGSIPAGPNPSMLMRLKAHARLGHTIVIITTRIERLEDCHKGMSNVVHFVEMHDLPVESIHFTNGKLKHDTIKRLGVSIHHDDCEEELERLPEGVEGVLAEVHPDWEGFEFP